MVTSLLILALLTTGTVLQNRVWSSNRALWENAVRRYPNAARATKALADQYMQQIRTEEALELYRKAANILPRFQNAHVGIVAALTSLKRYPEALEAADRVLQLWPEDPSALNLKGIIHQTLGDDREAIAAYERAVKSDPSFAQGYNNLGRLYVDQGDIDTAIEMYETAVAHDPSLADAFWNLAAIYRHDLEDEEKAAIYEEKARYLKRIQ